MTKTERHIAYLEASLTRVGKENGQLKATFLADCLSCKHGGSDVCNECPVMMKSKYQPIGVDEDAD